jgi:hypothetical protein
MEVSRKETLSSRIRTASVKAVLRSIGCLTGHRRKPVTKRWHRMMRSAFGFVNLDRLGMIADQLVSLPQVAETFDVGHVARHTALRSCATS